MILPIKCCKNWKKDSQILQYLSWNKHLKEENAVVEGFNISKGETLAIIDSDFTVDIDDSISAIMESTKMKTS